VTDTILVRDLRVVAVCGVGDEERSRPQPLRVDLDVVLEGTDGAATDALDDTVDYGALCDVAAAALDEQQPRLLEAACELVGRAVLGADRRVAAVEVTVTKLRPPVPHDVATVGARRHVAR
jgi:dihydroneopterin aldolase